MTGASTFGVALPCFGPFTDPGALRAMAGVAEELGYADVWFGDHIVVPDYAAALTPGDWVDPLTACFVGLGATERIGFGTDVLVLPYRNPVVVAKMAATAERLAPGRFTLGVGVGYLRGEFAALGAPPHEERGAVSDEYLEVMAQLWSATGPVSHHGRWIDFDEVHFGPRPPQGRVRTWVGGNAPAAWRRAARHGDGWPPLLPTPGAYATAKTAIESERVRLGLHRDFTWSMSCATTRVLTDPDGPWATNTWDETVELPDDFTYAPPVPAAQSGRPLMVGTVDQIADDVADYAAAGVEHFTLRFSPGAPDDTVEDLIAQMHAFAARLIAPLAVPTRP
jgi:probable F420-dependent oxidoreductase